MKLSCVAGEEFVLYDKEGKRMDTITESGQWKVLIVDDELEVHTVTKMVLAHYVYEGRGIQFIHAYSAKEAEEVFTSNSEIAIVMLDVVMEEEDSGLKFIGFIRNTCRNKTTRIILRTGQPGQVPEHRVIIEYDINDYKSKNELTYQKLFTSVTAALRAYSVILTLEDSKKELEKEKELLSATLYSIEDGVFALDTAGRITMMNAVAEKLTGFSFEEVHGKNADEIVSVISRNDGSKIPFPAIEELQSGASSSTEPAILKSRSGIERLISYSRAPIITPGGMSLGAIIVAKDVTAQVRAEEELKKIQKLESIGILAGGIAHDFNNVLTGIMGNISLTKLDMPKDKKGYGYLSDAEKAVIRAQVLTRQLLSFSKGSAPIKEPAESIKIIEESISTFLSTHSAEIKTDLDSSLPRIDADRGQLMQVMINILLNACEATGEKGTIAVKGTVLNLPAGNEYAIKEGKYLQIRISDNGCGITDEAMPKIFDPFFTTKQGKNGLGLTTSFTIVKRHGGLLTAKSDHGETHFDIVLPVCEIPQEVSHKSEDIRSPISVLLMDDDEFIVKSVSGIFTYFGIEAATAKDGAEAIEKYRQKMETGNPYSVVIMDLIIPGGMGGKQAIHLLREIDPGAVVLVSSGYSDDSIMAEYKKNGFDGVILKPYRPQELIEAVRNASSKRR